MTLRLRIFLISALLIAPMFLSHIQSAGLAVDSVLYNGKILTAASEDPFNFPIVKAMAVYRGRIVAVGNDQEILEMAGPTTKKIDLKGRTVLPGLIDTHGHIDQYAVDYFGKQLRDAPYYWLVKTSWATKEKGLAELEAIAKTRKPGEWIVLQRGAVETDLPVLFKVTRYDLDKVAPNNPVQIEVGVQQNHQVVNTMALEKLLKRYPNGLPGMIRDEKGVPNGFLKASAAGAMYHEFVPKPPADVLAPIYKKFMDRLVASGTTTVSTRLPSHSISAYNLLDQKGEMPLRIGYNPEIVDNHYDPDAVLSRVGNILGAGSDYLWVTGVSTVNIDGIAGWGTACIEKEYPRESKRFKLWRDQLFGPHGECKLSDPDFSDREAILAANRYGLRSSNIHIAGDRSLTEYLDLLEVANKEKSLVDRRFTVDHCVFVTDAHAKKAKALGVMFSCAPKYVHGGIDGPLGAYGEIYGEKISADVVVPMRRLIDAGLKTVMEVDTPTLSPFDNIEVLVTRRDKDGRVWGEHQRIDRREALYMYTRWAGEYVLKEKMIGTIEPDRMADIVVLDNDFLTIPDDGISDTKVLMTMVGGKIVFADPQFAAAEGLQQSQK